MRRPMAKKILAASLAAAMAMSAAACGESNAPAPAPAPAPSTETPAASTDAPAVEETPAVEEEVSPYTVIKDANGNIPDLGGMEIIVRDWWSPETPADPANDMEEEQLAYREWCMETYNFKIRSVAISDWGSAPADFVDYVTSGGDDNNYVFTLRGDAAVTSAMNSGLMYDLATLDCLDFSEAKFQNNKCHELYSKGSSIYAMFTGNTEPRTGMYFNKRLLEDAGINPNDIYDMQANGTWTWDAFEDLCSKVQADVDNDGTIDIWAIGVNEGNMTKAAVWSNGGKWVGMGADGKYTYEFESPETVEALEWTVHMFTEYDWNGPTDEDGNPPQWDWYKEQFLNGGCAFLPDDYYMTNPNGELFEMEDEIGFVMFPKGRSAKAKMCQVSSDNPQAIPSCYDADRAWKIAFAYNLYTEPVPGYEDFNNWVVAARTGNRDERTCDETIPMITSSAEVDYSSIVPNMDLGEGFLWSLGPGADVTAVLDGVRDKYKAYIDDANAAN